MHSLCPRKKIPVVFTLPACDDCLTDGQGQPLQSFKAQGLVGMLESGFMEDRACGFRPGGSTAYK